MPNPAVHTDAARESRAAPVSSTLASLLFQSISAHEYSSAIYLRKRLFAVGLAFRGASPAWVVPVSGTFGL